MSNRVYLGILGNHAKLELYSEEFYEFLKWDESKSCYYLLGASEKDVQKEQFQQMFNEIALRNSSSLNFPPIPKLTEGMSDNFTSRIGFFPSSVSHLIHGPEFTFAPYPINSKRTWLKFKSRFLATLIRPFVRLRVIPLAYHPMGGKAAERTKSDTTLDLSKISTRFIQASRSKYLKWLYFEGGSGEKFLGTEAISYVLSRISNGRRILDQMIYGGGITHSGMIDELFSMPVLPRSLVVGNISETNVSETFRILERLKELNESLI